MEDIKLQKNLKSLTPVSLVSLSRNTLRHYFKNTWELYEALFNSIIGESTFYLSPDPLRHPLIFYYGHTAAFYINKLVLSGILSKGVNAYYEEIFAKGVDPELPSHLERDAVWPSIAEVKVYREQVYDLVNDVINRVEIHPQINSLDSIWALLMGIEHDRIHFETSSVLIRQLSVDLTRRPAEWLYAPSGGSPSPNTWIAHPGGKAQIGKREPAELFGWDNEFGELVVDVMPFSATRNLVSNADYLEFVQDGGYEEDILWTDEAITWKRRTAASHPKFWLKTDQEFKYRAMFDLLDMPLDWPVEVNAHEARAYCHWKGENYRLLTEAEFRILTEDPINPDPVFSTDVNLNMYFGSPSPVGYFPENANGFNDLCGNVWDWLSDDFYPLPGFRAHTLYKDFSVPYFDELHSMLLGGSWSSTGTSASRYYRLWFRRHFFQHAGFRLAKSFGE